MRSAGRAWRALTAAGVVLVAWALLVVRLNDVPPGVQHDQVFNIVDAIELLYGRYRIYFTANYGREPLFIYSAAAFVKLAGGHFIWSLRLTSAVWATLAVAVSISLARRKLPAVPALVAVLLMVGSFWFLFTGRVGLRAISALTLGAATIYWLDRALAEGAWTRRSLAAFLLSGLFGGLALYTYLSARALLGLAPLLIVYEGVAWLLGLVQRKPSPAPGRRRLVAGLVASWLVMLGVSAPLLLWLRANPGAERRVGELTGPLGAAAQGEFLPLLRTIGEGISTLLWRDTSGLLYQYNLPDRPALLPFLAVLFVAGMALALPRVFRSRQERLWLAALALGLAPTLVTPGGPFYLRAIIAMPLVFVYVAAGLWGAGGWLQRNVMWLRVERTLLSMRFTPTAVMLVLALIAAHWAEAANAYYVRWPAPPEIPHTQLIYNADLRAAADFSGEAASEQPLYISTDFWLDLDQQTYLLYEPERSDVGWFYGPHGLPLPPQGGAATYVWTASAESSRDPALLPLYEQAQPASELLRVATLERDAVDAALELAGVRNLAAPFLYGDILELVAAGTVRWGDGFDLVTRWRVLQPWPRDMPPKLAARLIDVTGYQWAESSAPLALAFQNWQTGQEFVQVTHLSVPGDTPPGMYRAVASIYDDRNGALTVLSGGKQLATLPPAASITLTGMMSTSLVPDPPQPLGPMSKAGVLTATGVWDPPGELLARVPRMIRVSWQANGPIDTRQVAFEVRGIEVATRTTLWTEAAPPLQPLVEAWPEGQVWRLTHTLHPEARESGVTASEIEICARVGDMQPGCTVVARPQVVDRQVLLALPKPPQHASGARFGTAFLLEGYDLNSTVQGLRLTLYWKVAAAPSTGVQRFVHAVDESGRIVAQSDVLPANGGAPATSWQSGEFVIDTVDLVDRDAHPQAVQLYVGWYDPATGERLAVSAPAGAIQPDGRLAIPLPMGLGLWPAGREIVK